MAVHNKATTLVEKIWGSDFIQSIPERWKASFKYKRRKTPGVPNNTDPDTIVGLVVSSQVVTGRTNELEKETLELEADLETGPQYGQSWNPRLAANIEYIETLEPALSGIGEDGTVVTPVNSQLSEVRRPNFILPPTRVSYGYRKEELPLTLVSLAIVGSETRRAVPTYLSQPDLFLARYTRSYSFSPPTLSAPPQFWATPFHGSVEYDETANSAVQGTGNETGHSTRNGTHGSHSENLSTAYRSGTSNNSSSGTDHSEDTTTRELLSDSRHTDRTSNSLTTKTDSDSDGYFISEGGDINGENYDKNVSGSRTSASGGISDRQVTDHEDISGSGSTETLAISNNIRSATGRTSHNEDSFSTEVSDNNGTSQATEDSTSDRAHTSQTQTTRKNLLDLILPPCLHTAITVGGLSLPATNPVGLPWNGWLIRVSNSELGEFDVWITDKVEIFLPAIGSQALLTFYYLSNIVNLTGSNVTTDLEAQLIAPFAPGTIFEVDIAGRGVSQWTKTLWDGGGSPTSNTTTGYLKTPDYNALTMNYILVRQEGW